MENTTERSSAYRTTSQATPMPTTKTRTVSLRNLDSSVWQTTPSFQHIPDTTKEREILYITGPSGSGKSTHTRKYLEQYVKHFKGRPIYLFSSLPSDKSLDKIKPKKTRLDDSRTRIL